MQQITISGWAPYDSEVCSDNYGRNYKRFVTRCVSYSRTNTRIYTEYSCKCYLSQIDDIKKGDEVFLTGKLALGITQDEKGNPKLIANVHVNQIAIRHKGSEVIKESS